jgi:hypothetical protein
VIIVSIELSQFCAPALPLPERVRRGVVRPVAAPDFRAAAVVFHRAAARALPGYFMVFVADLEPVPVLGCVRLVLADGVFNPLWDRAGDCPGVFQLLRDCVV